MSIGHLRIYRIRKPTTVTTQEITSRQKKKTHGKRKNLTAKRKREKLEIAWNTSFPKLLLDCSLSVKKLKKIQYLIKTLLFPQPEQQLTPSETCCPQLRQNIFLPTSFECSKMAEMAGRDDQPLIPLLHFLIPWCASKTRPSPHALFYAVGTLLLLFLLPYDYFFCRESFTFAVRFFSFVVSLFFQPWGFFVCRESFPFVMRFFSFAVSLSLFAVLLFLFVVKFFLPP